MAGNDLWRVPYSGQQIEDSLTNSAPRINVAGRWEIWDIHTSEWVDTGIEASGKGPYIGSDHYWYVWDAAQNAYVKTAYTAAINGISAVNGIFPDATGNLTLPWTGIAGENPIAKGGTGGATAGSALHNLISGASVLDASGLAGEDRLGVDDVSAGNGKRMTVANLVTYLNANLGYAKIAHGSYVGTGTAGVDNPTTLTFPFAPVIVWIPSYRTFKASSGKTLNWYSTYEEGYVLMQEVPTEYAEPYKQTKDLKPRFYPTRLDQSSYYVLYRKSADGRTLQFYCHVFSTVTSNNATAQLNTGPTSTTDPTMYEYQWIAIG